MHVSAIFVYPVKSLGPVALERATVEPCGLKDDRRWMIVDEAGRFVTRREVPALATIAMREGAGSFRLVHRDGQAVLDESGAAGERAAVTIWRDRVAAEVFAGEASRLVSHVAGRPLRLARLEPGARAIAQPHGRPGETVSLADAYPLLVASEASLGALNAALDAPVPMARFRPNVVLAGEGLSAWDERGWARIAIGSLRCRLPKPCVRCIVITQDVETGARREGNAVPKALRRLGQFGDQGALFGMNAIPDAGGEIAIGDPVTVTERA